MPGEGRRQMCVPRSLRSLDGPLERPGGQVWGRFENRDLGWELRPRKCDRSWAIASVCDRETVGPTAPARRHEHARADATAFGNHPTRLPARPGTPRRPSLPRPAPAEIANQMTSAPSTVARSRTQSRRCETGRNYGLKEPAAPCFRSNKKRPLKGVRGGRSRSPSRFPLP